MTRASTLRRAAAVVCWFVIAIINVAATPATPEASQQQATALDSTSVPLLAYYYIWFDESSWDHAKIDMPLLGRYSSGDEKVVRQHIRWAKAAGIDGFIVSWKGTARLNERLETLMRVANDEDFKLSIIYQGLDVDREPLPARHVAEDLDLFVERYAKDPVFSLFAKPLVIWSGTWRFSVAEIQGVTATRRTELFILASERNSKGFERIADLVDGDAYYWSSVNPATYPDYPGKLRDMATVVHDAGGLWIAPAAPGFNAKALGGTTVVDRDDGRTLLTQLDVAVRSLPDAIGLISWNEFSENSHVEPSVNNRDRELRILADYRKQRPIAVNDPESSSPEGVASFLDLGRILALALVVATGALGVAVTVRRRRREQSPPET